MSNDSSGTHTNQGFDYYTVIAEAEYLPGKVLITALSEPFTNHAEASKSLKHLSCSYPHAKIRAERIFV